MKLGEEADKLVRDYWVTAKSEVSKGKNWNILTSEQQKRLTKYWGQEKARKEQELTNQLAEQAQRGKELEPEIEIAKFHEERRKIKCSCYDCEAKKEIKKQIKKEMFSEPEKKVKCSECGRWVKALDEENGICKKCVKSYIV